LKPGFVEKNYNEFALNNYLFYIRKFAGMRRLLSKVDRIFITIYWLSINITISNC